MNRKIEIPKHKQKGPFGSSAISLLVSSLFSPPTAHQKTDECCLKSINNLLRNILESSLGYLGKVSGKGLILFVGGFILRVNPSQRQPVNFPSFDPTNFKKATNICEERRRLIRSGVADTQDSSSLASTFSNKCPFMIARRASGGAAQCVFPIPQWPLLRVLGTREGC
ncbi:uncharacterized protein BDW43DRAFT_242916 [Aspergillus alliaceus]|uniref:uncharacterized protein n=1 Tax=Petromyces alliaceus TaxID=209559 RepID=UPI0012A44B0D|nr:uncharacterized protein BDW43DRAFT_242916 [Aspergillus alliaceus]KAB8227633.1 hypothetical protein BDW43DRAFT_242916 [Aspergillus alliaceus]